MPLSWQEVTDVPEIDYTTRKRRSRSQELVDAVLASSTGKMEAASTDPKELDRFYKSLLQWKGRHVDVPIKIRKNAGRIYVWRELTQKARTPDTSTSRAHLATLSPADKVAVQARNADRMRQSRERNVAKALANSQLSSADHTTVQR